MKSTENTERAAVEVFFDVVSPFSFLLDLALRARPEWLIIRTPVLFAGLLKANGNLGPAEISTKRVFTYEYCTWYARSLGIPFRMPAAHPFNPLPYQRLIIAGGCTAEVTSHVFDTVWTTGADPSQPELIGCLARKL